jgi:hypothetical protein
MPTIKLESLREGMITAAEVKNMDNMLLIPANTALTERHINVLNAWGITEIQVQACADAEEAVDILQRLPKEVLDRLTNELKAVFWSPAEKNPVELEVFMLALRRKARQSLTTK